MEKYFEFKINLVNFEHDDQVRSEVKSFKTITDCVNWAILESNCCEDTYIFYRSHLIASIVRDHKTTIQKAPLINMTQVELEHVYAQCEKHWYVVTKKLELQSTLGYIMDTTITEQIVGYCLLDEAYEEYKSACDSYLNYFGYGSYRMSITLSRIVMPGVKECADVVYHSEFDGSEFDIEKLEKFYSERSE